MRTAHPIPSFYRDENVADWNYGPNARAILAQAEADRRRLGTTAAAADRHRIGVLVIDAQRDFCHKEGTLFVAGNSGEGAIEDNRRLCRFLYENAARITEVNATYDTHVPFQIFSPAAWVDAAGKTPEPYTVVSHKDVAAGRYALRPAIANLFGFANVADLGRYALHYTAELERGALYQLMLWPEHCLVGTTGHCLVGAVAEAKLYHDYLRLLNSNNMFKGGDPRTENYSVFNPEVVTLHDGTVFAQRDTAAIKFLDSFDMVVVAGQAASHCVKSSIESLLGGALQKNPDLARKVYVMRDCMSPVVTPYQNFTDQTEAAFKRFAAAGMHIVRSTEPMESWPDVRL